MRTSEHIDKIAPALLLAQSGIKAAIKNSENPHFRSSYADFGAIVDACRESLIKSGIVVIQSPGGDGQVVTMTTRLLHTSGQWIEGEFSVRPTKTDPQGCGSAVTYMRRYSLASMVGIVTEDDDGNAASAPVPTSTPAQRPAPKQAPATGRAVLAEAVRKWSGVKPEDERDAMLSVKKAAGITSKAASDDEIAKMLAFVEANKNKKFEEVCK